MLLGAAAGMAGGGLTSAALGYTVASLHGKTAAGTLALVGGLTGVFMGLLTGILLGGGLALYISREPPPHASRFQLSATLLCGAAGLILAMFGVLIITVFEDIETGLAGTYILGGIIGTGGGASSGYLMALAMGKFWGRFTWRG